MKQCNHRIFDRELVRRRRDRASRSFERFSFLKKEVAERLGDRLASVKRPFDVTLDLGAHLGETRCAVEAARLSTIGPIVSCDLSARMAAGAGGLSVAADEEALPFAASSFSLIVSALSLHWVNDLPGALIQIRRTLKPDGLFLGAMLGGETLRELRESLVEAELETCGGASPRVSPAADVRDLGGLLQRAGFALPVSDCERLTVRYRTMFNLLDDLRGMGETNALFRRSRKPLTRAVLMRAGEIYQERFAGSDGRVPATFDVITMTGWAPHESQQKPLKPGSAQARLADALGAVEQPLNDKG